MNPEYVENFRVKLFLLRREKSQFYLVWEFFDIYGPTANNSAVKTWALANCDGTWNNGLFVT
jgi:hypothetical protein